MPRVKPPSLPVIHILLALADGARHGYAIKQAVEQRTGGAIRLGPGTLYEAIQRLQDGGLIEETAARRDEPANGRRRSAATTADRARVGVAAERAAGARAARSTSRAPTRALRKGLA